MRSTERITVFAGIAVLLLSLAAAYAQGIGGAPVQKRQGVVDLNGDGICDITGQPVGSGPGSRQGVQAGGGSRQGPGDGTGNQGQRPKDGTGYGAHSGKGNGPQDCTQPRIGQGTRPLTGAGASNRVRKGGRP